MVAIGIVGLVGAVAVAFAAGDLAGVASLVRRGDGQGALTAIGALPESVRATDSVRYLEGRLLLEVDRPCDAMGLLVETGASLPDSMRTDARWRWALAAARCGRCAEARPVLLGLNTGSASARRRTRVAAAECAVELEDFDAAVRELEGLTKRSAAGAEGVALLVALSDLYQRLDRPDAAREAARRAWIAAVGPGQQDLAAELAERAQPNPSDRLERAKSLVRRRRFSTAVAELARIEVDDDSDWAPLWYHTHGMALFKMRTRYADAARVLRKSASFESSHQVEDAFHAARALSRADHDARAIRAYRRFAQTYPQSTRAAEARFLASWLEIRLGRSVGERNMQRLLVGERALRGKWRRSALWEVGFRAFERRRYARAVRYLSEYAELATSAMEQARGLYWLGRAYRRGPKAVAAYRGAIEVEPLHWYAVLAASRLSRIGVEPPAPFSNGEPAPRVVALDGTIPIPSTYQLYSDLGLDRDALRWLKDHEGELVAPYPRAHHLPLLLTMYDSVGAHREALQLARRRMSYLRQEPSVHRWWWNAAYPMPWLATVDAHREHLPRALIYATMRQESGYLPHVVSRAGAVGLMQVMPEVAARIEGRPVTRTMLELPEYNIPIGVAEMKKLAADFGDAYPLSIAAYNAGSKRVRRWLRESRRMELDRFVERIPFRETRNYVRRVTTHYARYAYLDDPDSGWPALPRFVSP